MKAAKAAGLLPKESLREEKAVGSKAMKTMKAMKAKVQKATQAAAHPQKMQAMKLAMKTMKAMKAAAHPKKKAKYEVQCLDADMRHAIKVLVEHGRPGLQRTELCKLD